MASSLSRRDFLKAAAGSSLALCLPLRLRADAPAGIQPLCFGVCADVHKDVMHDADARLQAFLTRAAAAKTDFIVQLGDFCQSKPQNQGFLKIWESFVGPRYHVLGNHERDSGKSWEQVTAFLGMKQHYYSFDHGGWHFVALDGNEQKPGKRAAGYARFIGAAQLAWLENDLRQTRSPTIIFSHQTLGPEAGGLENAAAVRGLLEKSNGRANRGKVVACLCGHHHIDAHCQINGIHYIHVNSTSYSWLGEKYRHARYGPAIDRAYPSITSTAPYQDPLFAIVRLDPKGLLIIEGVRSEFVGPSPWELGMPENKAGGQDKEHLVPRISNRQLSIATA